jgi:hypothetical protein
MLELVTFVLVILVRFCYIWLSFVWLCLAALRYVRLRLVCLISFRFHDVLLRLVSIVYACLGRVTFLGWLA